MSSETAHISDTLRILHLPPQLTNERRTELFQKYGAVKTRTLRPRGQLYTITFAKFPSQQAATQALLRLHQLNVRGQRLVVEYAKKSISVEAPGHEVDDEEKKDENAKKETPNTIHFQAFLNRLNSWTMNQIFTQPPPPNIRYKYGLPTKNTLIRIAIQLLKEPAFYTQVLHLMNRMNLPPPFEELESEFPMLKEIYDMEKYKNIFGMEIYQNDESKMEEEVEEEEEGKEEETEESEIESDDADTAIPVEIIPMKRKRSQQTKKIKIRKFVNPAKQIVSTTSLQKSVKPEDMFEQVQLGENKNLRIELKTVDKLLDTPSNLENSDINPIDGGFGLMYPTKSTETTQNDESEKRVQPDVITSEELGSNRISANDQRVLSVFKNYHPGKPSNRLYIKNLAKQVDINDLHFIYRKFVIPESKDTDQQYDVRLMQGGRMKGQAFVTLQNTTAAQLALEETNGYILKDKPMVVQFAKHMKS